MKIPENVETLAVVSRAMFLAYEAWCHKYKTHESLFNTALKQVQVEVTT